MKTFLIGSKELSCIILDELVSANFEVMGVYVRDDEPSMKVWHELGHRSLADEASKLGIPVHYGMKVNSPESLSLLQKAELDIIFSCFWGELFKEPILNIAKRGVFNFHTAFLPHYRGSRPIPWAIIDGAEHTGLTIHKMMTGVDNGPIVAQSQVKVQTTDTARTLYDKVIQTGKALTKQVLQDFRNDDYHLVLQDEEQATYRLRGEPFGGQINRFWEEALVNRFQRAMTFPPFRSYRLSPHHQQKPEVVASLITTSRAQSPSFDSKVLADAHRYKDHLSGGSVWQRNTLKSLFSIGKKRAVKISPPIDLEQHLPVLESIRMNGYTVVLEDMELGLTSADLIRLQPSRMQNGILSIPIVGIEQPEMIKSYLMSAQSLAEQENCPIYLIFECDSKNHETCEELLSQQILKVKGRIVTIDDVCNEFDTPYENFST